MKSMTGCLSACILIAVCYGEAASAKDLVRFNSQVVAGWIEPVFVESASSPISAKLDTGAKTSSLNAAGLTMTTKDGQDWVSFSIETDTGEVVNIEQPVVRTVRIRRAGTGVKERPVIRLQICLAGQRGDAEFTLADRSKMSHQILIGRAFLAKRVLVDSEARNLTEQSCGN